jgi:hypothetical protein
MKDAFFFVFLFSTDPYTTKIACHNGQAIPP